MYPHRIRLRGPWDYEVLAATSSIQTAGQPSKGTLNLPCRWSDGPLAGVAGRVRLRRRFGWPGRLDAHERVWLTFSGAIQHAAVALNDQAIGEQEQPAGGFEFAITELLSVRNVLSLTIDVAEGDTLWGDVALEVRCPAFLRDVRFEVTPGGGQGKVSAHGVVVGEASGPLDLYLLINNATAAQAAIAAGSERREFQLTATELKRPLRLEDEVRVELMQGGVVWYVAERNANDTTT